MSAGSRARRLTLPVHLRRKRRHELGIALLIGLLAAVAVALAFWFLPGRY